MQPNRGQTEGKEPPTFSSPQRELEARELAKQLLSAAFRKAEAQRIRQDKSIAIWGTGAAATGYLAIDPDIEPSFFVESQPRQSVFRGTAVFSPADLPQPGKIFIVICSDAHAEISATLERHGYEFGKDFGVAEIYPNRLHLYCTKSQTGASLAWMRKHVAYVECRARPLDLSGRTPPLPEWGRARHQIDLLIYPTEVPAMLSCPHLSLEPNEVLFDIQWSPPLGLPGEVPMFSWKFRSLLFSSRRGLRGGLLGPGEFEERLLYAYHILIHKAEASGLQASVAPTAPQDNRYVMEGLNHFSMRELSLDALAQLLEDNGLFPPASEVHAWAEALGSDYLRSRLVSKSATSDQVVVFFLRGEINSRMRDALRSSANAHSMSLGDFTRLSETQKALVFRHVRGGVWNETPASLAAGPPTEIAVGRPLTVSNLDELAALGRAVKTKARESLSGSSLEASKVNWLHSTDFPLDAAELCDLLKEPRVFGNTNGGN